MNYLLEIKSVTIITIAATILGSIIPMKSHAEEISKSINEKTINQVSTQSSLTAPSIIQGRVVNTKYTQMPMPAVEAYSNEDGTETGYLDISWEPIEGVTKYQIILFNGSVHSNWDVPADETTWTTKDKGMFPTSEQSTYTLTPSIALSGISFSVSPAKKFSFHPDTHASITW
ncbi:hypothetical protein AB1282_23925 [Gottfriedia sp. S16(2024)]|uniref:hypothetical protein n=1 Tax=Gottfriedia sp. S16(2024) TaxID=3162883 RepID=UPI003D21E682